MPRILRPILATAFCVLLVVLWVLSQDTSDTLTLRYGSGNGTTHALTIDSAGGGVGVEWARHQVDGPAADGPASVGYEYSHVVTYIGRPRVAPSNRFGFAAERVDVGPDLTVTDTTGLPSRTESRRLRVPYWFLTLLAAAVTARSILRYHRHARRASAGLCPRCGYDLRASPDRCPECGAEPTTAMLS